MKINLDDLAVTHTADERKWSEFQLAIFDHCKEMSSSLLVNAVAGSGKTTTIVAGADYIPHTQSSIFLAFNKSIANELGQRLPPHIPSATINAVGHQIVQANRRDLRFNKRKVFGWIDKRYANEKPAVKYVASQLVDYARLSGVGIDVPEDLSIWWDIVEHMDIDLPSESTIGIARAAFAYATSTSCREFDFADQLYLPLAWNMDFAIHMYDNVVIDEVQDMSPLKHMFIARMVKPGGHVLGVGDPYQAIYGFAGADSASMSVFRETFKCRELPLSITYRNPKSVVEVARTLVSYIRAADDAEDGFVNLNAPGLDIESLTGNDMIICRNNAPLFKTALSMLAARRPFTLVGDFGETMRRLINRFKTNDVLIFKKRFREWYEKEADIARSKEKWSKLALLDDKHAAVMAIYEGHRTVDEMLSTLDRLLLPGAGPRISSIHRAKGLEADRVFLIESQLIPSKYAKLDWMREQERNLLYVAYTRARKELYAIPGKSDNDPMEDE